MVFAIGFLAFVMVLVCLVLILLVLMQLPKKDAGAGLAFGGTATDALFGAGSGNFLTKATKYAASIFFVLAVVLSILQSRFYHQRGSELERQLQQQNQQAPAAVAPPQTELPAPAASAPAESPLLIAPPGSTDAAPAAPATPDPAPQ